jgi:hypothetical protein
MMVLDPISKKRFLVGWNIHRQFQKFPPIRREFLTLPQARSALQKRPKWSEDLRGDLQMHSTWSDGSGAVPYIAAAAEERGTNMPRSPIIRLRIAKAAGVHPSLGTDADGPAKLRFMESSALLAGIEPARIFNHISNKDLLGWVDSLRRKSSKTGVSGADSKSTQPRKRKLPSIRT